MYCPKCDHELQRRRFGDVEVDQCLRCHGIWLDSEELPLLRKQKNTNYGEVLETAVYDSVGGPCPRCRGNGHMTRLNDLKRPEIVMDSCSVCYGVWLDGGELDKLTESNLGLSLKAFLRDLVD